MTAPHLQEFLGELRAAMHEDPDAYPTLREAWLMATEEERLLIPEDRQWEAEMDWRAREMRKHAGRVAYAGPARPGDRRVGRIDGALRRFIRRTHPWCHYCGGLGTELDHIYPRARGGSDERSNLANACRRCNLEKFDLTVDEWRRKREGRGDPWPPPAYWPPEVFERFERSRGAAKGQPQQSQHR